VGGQLVEDGAVGEGERGEQVCVGGRVSVSSLSTAGSGAAAPHHTSVWALVGADIAEVDNMFCVEPLEEGVEPGRLDVAEREGQCLDPRRGNGQQ